MIGSLGTVALTTGTPIQITTHAPTAVSDAKRLGAQRVRIQAMPANAGVVWVGLKGMEGSPLGPYLIGVIGKPTAGTGPCDFFEFGDDNVPGGINLYDIWVQGLTSDNVIVSYVAN